MWFKIESVPQKKKRLKGNIAAAVTSDALKKHFVAGNYFSIYLLHLRLQRMSFPFVHIYQLIARKTLLSSFKGLPFDKQFCASLLCK